MPKASKDDRGAGLGRWLHLLLPVALLTLGPVLLLSGPGRVERLHDWVFDGYQRLKPRAYQEAPVRIVDIDDESLTRLGQWPWPRTLLARLVDRLTELGASAIAFDAVFSEPDRTSPKQVLPLWAKGAPSPLILELSRRFPDHDAVFARSIARSRVVLGSALTQAENHVAPRGKARLAIKGGDPIPLLDQFPGAVANLEVLEQAAAGNGSFAYIPEHDGVNRRMPLFQRLNDSLVPMLATEALRVAQGVDRIGIKTTGAKGDVGEFEYVKIGDLSIPTDHRGRVWLYFRESSPERFIPVWKLLEPKFDGKALSGAIVFVGTSATGLKDQRATPLSPLTPGVEIHAQAAEQILLGQFLTRPGWALDGEVVILVLIGGLLIAILQRRGAVWGAIFAGIAIPATLYGGWWAFAHRRLLLDPVFPSAIVALIFVSYALVNFLQGEREKREIRNAFQFYLSPELVERLATHPENLRLGGEMRRMTFHFCDIEGFTSISEFYDPEGLIHFLNSFLSPLTEIILRHNGTIDKYIGDCIVAFWNAPVDDPDHAKHACLAVIEMQEQVARLNEARRAQAEADGKEHVPIKIRTGLNSGNCMVGNMGSYQRFSYSVIGDDVNLASRLEGANKFFGTRAMASEATMSQARDAVESRFLGSLRVVGKVVPVQVHELLAAKGRLSEVWKRALPVYEGALKDYYARRFEQAANAFQEVLDAVPKDGPSSLYLKAATQYIHAPPPESWDGVFQLKEK